MLFYWIKRLKKKWSSKCRISKGLKIKIKAKNRGRHLFMCFHRLPHKYDGFHHVSLLAWLLHFLIHLWVSERPFRSPDPKVRMGSVIPKLKGSGSKGVRWCCISVTSPYNTPHNWLGCSLDYIFISLVSQRQGIFQLWSRWATCTWCSWHFLRWLISTWSIL